MDVFLAEAARITGTSLHVKSGLACNISATIPETNGHADDVPLRIKYKQSNKKYKKLVYYYPKLSVQLDVEYPAAPTRSVVLIPAFRTTLS